MKAETGRARARISQALGHSVGGRFFRVAALGALLVGAAALYSSISQGEAVSSLASSIDQRFPPGTLSEDMARTEIATLSIDQRFPPGTLSEEMPAMVSATLSIDQRFPPGSLSEDMARTEIATLSTDQRFPPGTLPEDMAGTAPTAYFEIDPAWDRAIEQRELLKDYRAMGIPWEYDALGNMVELPGKTAMGSATLSIDQRFPPGTLPED